MGTDFGFDDDFFDEDFSAEEPSEVKPNESRPPELAAGSIEMPSVFTENNGTIELLVLYDEGSLKENLISSLSRTEYSIVEANDLGSAREVLRDHPNLGIVVSNSTVAGDDAASILRSLVSINPDIISIICTDMIDLLSFMALINTAPVYKILTFPLDIDKELIPALGELASVSLVRRITRDERNEVKESGEDYDRKLQEAIRINRLRQGAIRKMYNGMLEVLAKTTKERCNDPFGNTVKTINAFQRKVVERFFLSISPGETPMETQVKTVLDAFDNAAEGKNVSVEIKNAGNADPGLCSRVVFVLWLLFYRLALTGPSYKGHATVDFKGPLTAFVVVTYDINAERWFEINKNNLQSSYTTVSEGIADSFSTVFGVSGDAQEKRYEASISIVPNE